MAGLRDSLTGPARWAISNFTVHDTVSCVGLAVVGAAAVATAANPFAWGAVGAGIATSVAGNLATSVLQKLDRDGTNMLLSGWRGIDENHVVVQGLRKAHLDALRAVLKTFRGVAETAPDRDDLDAFADRVAAFARMEWTAAERLQFKRPDNMSPAEDEIRRAVLDALPINFGTALARRQARPVEAGPHAALDDLCEALVAGALAEVQSRTMLEGEDLPPAFTALFRGEGTSDSWFDLFIRAAADRLKGEDAFAAIWNAEQVAHTDMLVKEVAGRVARIELMLGAPIRRGDASVKKFGWAIRNRPTDLLVARYRVIPYLDRGGLLAGAVAWALATDGPEAQGRLYVAPGGFGKTRFAIELVLALMDEGWACTFLSERNTRNLAPGALTGTVAGDEAAGRLVVLDYAESQIALLKQVADAAAESISGVPIRILALARSAEGWWQGTRDDRGMASVFEPAPFGLIETVLDGEEREDLFARGVVGFREALTDAGLAMPQVEGAPPGLPGGMVDRPLTVAMAAFLVARGAPVDGTTSLFKSIFSQERGHWKRVLGVQADNDPLLISLHRAAAQVTLVQGATPEGAAALVAADPRAVVHGLPAQEATLAALERIYGNRVGEDALLRPIEPDLLGEHAAMAALAADHHGLIEAVFTTTLKGPPLFDVDVAAVLTVLTRATRQEHDARTGKAARAAIRRLGAMVLHIDAAQVRQVQAACPRFAMPLTDFSVAVEQRVVETSDDGAEMATSLYNLAIRLSQTGERQAALAPARRAVEIQEALARDNPAAYLPELAASLNNLATFLSETGERQAALAPARRAVEIREALARDNPAAYLPDLAMSLNNLAIFLSETGERQAALAPARRAVETYEALARDNPAAYLPALAMSLGTFGDAALANGEMEAALPAYGDSLRAFCDCLPSAPQRFFPFVVMTADRLEKTLAATGRGDEVEASLHAIMGDDLFEAYRAARASDS